MNALHAFERLAGQTGKHVSESAICFDEVALGVLPREGQLGRQRGQVFPGGLDERTRHSPLRLDDFRLRFAIFAAGRWGFFGPLGHRCRCRIRIRLCFLFELALVGSAAFEVEIDDRARESLCGVIAGDGASYWHSFDFDDTAAHSEEVSV